MNTRLQNTNNSLTGRRWVRRVLRQPHRLSTLEARALRRRRRCRRHDFIKPFDQRGPSFLVRQVFRKHSNSTTARCCITSRDNARSITLVNNVLIATRSLRRACSLKSVRRGNRDENRYFLVTVVDAVLSECTPWISHVMRSARVFAANFRTLVTLKILTAAITKTAGTTVL